MKKKATDRLNEIIKVFALYGSEIIIENKLKHTKSAAKHLRKAFEELGPTFVKIGQILSTRTDIFPKEYIYELSKLQDSVKAESYDIVKQTFKESVHKEIEDCFESFSENPIASASIAQVHKGILKGGEKVVIKVQRPGIYKKMKLDISILRRIVRLTRISNHIQVVDLLDMLNELEMTIEKELNFKEEANNIIRFKENNKDVGPIYVPNLIEELCSNKIIVLEEIKGFKINDIEKIRKEHYNTEDIAKKLALCYCKQIFDDGFFHGDPHPGNILIYNNRICFIDFGIMGELDANIIQSLNDVIFAIITKDKNMLVDFLLGIGIKSGRIDRGKLFQDVSYLFDTYVSASLKDIKVSVFFEEIFLLTRNNNIQFPRELVTLFRGLVILEGVIVGVDANVNILSVVKSFVKNRGNFDLTKIMDGEKLILSTYAFFRDTIEIPSKTMEILNSISNDGGKINFKIADIDKILKNIHDMVNRLTCGLMIASLLIASSLIIRSSSEGISTIGVVGYLFSALFAIILLFSMIKAKKVNKK
ncbi:MAG: AarF/ABC1/UbiB kinase family protein [Clostridium sp.]|nr:AarF/ABC1/UbiB kinase family protein [Clostridium sp.]